MVQIYLCKCIYAYAKYTNNTNELLLYIYYIERCKWKLTLQLAKLLIYVT